MTKSDLHKVTVPVLQAMKSRGEKISALTAYDFPTAKIVDQAGIDIILVGDSLGMVVLGYENTIPVTMEEMLHHTKAVTRGVTRALVVGDMPYFSFHQTRQKTVANAARFLKEAGARAVKIEGAGRKRLGLIAALVEAEIPVMGHVGLTPQSIHHLGHFKVTGKISSEAQRIIDEALRIESAGAFAVVLECIPMELAKIITRRLRIPTIGIGAGPGCDGQILVFHDLAGYSNGYLPKFVHRFAHLNETLRDAVGEYRKAVCEGTFPDDTHSYHLKSKEVLQGIMEKEGKKKL